MLKLAVISVILVCQIVRAVYMRKQNIEIPAEIKKHEDYVLAKNRVHFGTRMAVAGMLMAIVPLAALLILKDLHGIWARASVFSLLCGIPLAVAGIVFLLLGGSHVAKAEAEYFAGAGIETEPENRICTVCNIVSCIASAALLAVILIE